MSPLRADAERTVQAILEAAEQVLSADPAASMEQIAEQAGVARTTVHRRFATREALIEALAASAVRQIEQAVAAARPRTAPPLVALHQGTANLLGVKLAWRFAVTQISPGSPAARTQQRVIAELDLVLQRLQQGGLIRADTDLLWARRAYKACSTPRSAPVRPRPTRTCWPPGSWTHCCTASASWPRQRHTRTGSSQCEL